MKNIFIKYTFYYILEKGNHSYRNKKLTPTLTLVHGKNKTFFSIRLKNLDKNNKKNVLKEDIIKKELERKFLDAQTNIFLDYKYLERITDNKLFDNIDKIVNLYDEDFQINKKFIKKVLKPFIGLAILFSGLKGIIPELRNKNMKDILNDDEFLKNIQVSNIKVMYDYIYDSKEIKYNIIFNNKIKIKQNIKISENSFIILENDLISSLSNEKFNIENLNMYQVAFMEILKQKLNLDNYKILAFALTSIDSGYIGGGVWLRKGYSIETDFLNHIYKNVIDFYKNINKNEELKESNISNLNEFKKLINFMIKNNISSAKDDFNIFNKFINFDFEIISKELKDNIISYIKDLKSYILETEKIIEENKRIKLYNIFNLIENRLINTNKIKLFDLLKIIDNFYYIFIDDKDTFLENLKASMIR